MKIRQLTCSQRVPAPLDDAFGFYADAFNLEQITPPWLRFRVITPGPIAMGVGALIGYRLRLHGVRVNWLTRIEEWEPQRRFVDAQLVGPYRLWHHTHAFEPAGDDATIVKDVVRYVLPYGPFGELARRAFVARDLERIFAYRHEAIVRCFTK